jgi:hypothetical protein
MSGVRNLLGMAERFSWSELQPRDSASGSLTMAGWIERIQPWMWRLNFCDWGTHLLYFVLRGVAGSGRPFFYNTWFPFDSDDVASYILVIIIQVTGYVCISVITQALAYSCNEDYRACSTNEKREKIKSANIKGKRHFRNTELDGRLV